MGKTFDPNFSSYF